MLFQFPSMIEAGVENGFLDLKKALRNEGQAIIQRIKVFVPSNLKQVSNFTLANLYWYFAIRDESQVENLVEYA